MKVPDNTSAIPVSDGSPKNTATALLPPASRTVRTSAIAMFSQNRALMSAWLIWVFCVEASLVPRSISIGAKPTNAITMATRPKSWGLSKRARRIVEAS